MKKIIFFIGLLSLSKAKAFSVIPMVVEFADRGRPATQTFTASHDKGAKIAVEVFATTRVLDLLGKEKRKVTKDLIIYPPQLILKAGDSKKIRVTYVGKKFMARQKSYRIIFRQLPVDLKKKKATEKASLKFLFEYVASVYVNGPDRPKPKLKIMRVKKSKNDSYNVDIKNIGGSYQLLKNWQLSSIGKNGKQRVHPFNLSEKKVLPNLLSGSKVRFKVKAKSPKKWRLKKNK